MIRYVAVYITKCMVRWVVPAALCFFATLSSAPAAETRDVSVSAAVSLKEAMTDVARQYERGTSKHVQLNFGATGQLLATFPRELVAAVARLGSGLLPDESIEFRPPSGSAPRFSVNVRQKFIELGSTRYEQPVEVEGIVEAVDLRDGAKTFRVRSEQHDDVEISLLAGLEHAALDFAKFRWPIVVKGVGEFSAAGKLLRIHSVSALDLGHDPEVEVGVAKLTARLTELKALSRGWLDGDAGEPLSPPAIALIEELIAAYAEQNTPKFFAFPTPQGGARLEWEVGKWDTSVESDPEGKEIVAHALNLSTGEERTRACATSADIVDFVLGL